MRLLHCIPTLGLGGAERQVACLTEAFVGAGHETHLALLRPQGAYQARLCSAGVRLHLLRYVSHHDPRIHTQLVALARCLQPAVLQTWLPLMDVAGGLAALRTGAPWVLSERNSAEGYSPSLKVRMRRWLGRRAGAVVANSAAGLTYWRDGGRRPLRLLTIPNAVPRDAIDAAPPADLAAAGITRDLPIVLYVGRLEASKNLGALVAALTEPQLRGRAQVVCCGEGSARAELEARAWQAGVGASFRFLGRRDDVWGWMKRAAVFVSPSRYEGMPNAVVEAMTCACPIVVSDIGAHREILDVNCARFVSPDDAPALALAIAEVLEVPERARRLGEAARARAAEWSVARSAVAYLELYQELASEAGR